MKNRNYLVEHLLDPAFFDEPSSIVFPGDPLRLILHSQGFNGNWVDIARSVADSPSVVWLPDANVAILNETEAVWDALRIVAMESGRESAIVTVPVLGELLQWLRAPYRNKTRANAIQTALKEKSSWVQKCGLDGDSPVRSALLSYVRLLGARRYLARPVDDQGMTAFDTHASAKCETMNAIKNTMGHRALGLAKKGRNDAERNGKVILNDEMHCLLAIWNALNTGRESVILTADTDLIEIFYKAQWFIDTHYRAWLAARMVKAGGYGHPAGELVDTKGYFEGPLVLYRRYTNQLREVLPPVYSTVRVHLVYVSPHGHIERWMFPFEREMLEMIEVRGKTCGRCTEFFGDANIHVDLGPLKPGMDGLYLGIGRDATSIAKLNGTDVVLSRLDIAHSLNNFERHTRIRR